MPFFSIVIPLYNKESSITDTLQSIKLQSFEDYEVIIVNDGSTDDSLARIQEYINDKFSAYSQENQGVSKARNEAIHYASGKYIVFLDADDLMLPSHLSTLYQLIKKHPRNSIFSTGHYIKENGETLAAPTSLGVSFQGIVQDPFRVLSQGLSLLNSSTTCVERCKLNSPYLFPEKETRGEDLHLWILLINRYSICHDSKKTVVVNRDSDCRSAHIALKSIPAHFKIILKMFETNSIDKRNMKSLKRFYLLSAMAIAAFNKLHGDTTFLKLIIRATFNGRWYLEAMLLSMVYLVPNSLFRKIKKVRKSNEK